MANKEVWCDISQISIVDHTNRIRKNYKLSQIAFDRDGLNPLHPVNTELGTGNHNFKDTGFEYIVPIDVHYDGRTKRITGRDVVSSLSKQGLINNSKDERGTLVPSYEFDITDKLKQLATEEHAQISREENYSLGRKLSKAHHANQLWRHAYDQAKGGNLLDMDSQSVHKSLVRTANLEQRLVDEIYLKHEPLEKAIDKIVDPNKAIRRKELALRKRQQQLSLDI